MISVGDDRQMEKERNKRDDADGNIRKGQKC